MTLKKLFFTHSGRAGKLYIKKLGSINAQIKLWSLKKESCKSFSKPRFKENFCLRQSWQRKQKRGGKRAQTGQYDDTHEWGNMGTGRRPFFHCSHFEYKWEEGITLTAS